MDLTEPSEFITLKSSDGYEFIVTRKSAYNSETIKRMLDPRRKLKTGRGKETKDGYQTYTCIQMALWSPQPESASLRIFSMPFATNMGALHIFE